MQHGGINPPINQMYYYYYLTGGSRHAGRHHSSGMYTYIMQIYINKILKTVKRPNALYELIQKYISATQAYHIYLYKNFEMFINILLYNQT